MWADGDWTYKVPGSCCRWSGLDPGALWWRKVPPQRALSDPPTGGLGLRCPSTSLSGRFGGSEGCGCTMPRASPLTRPPVPGLLGFTPAAGPQPVCTQVCVWPASVSHPPPALCPLRGSLSMGTLAPRFCCWRSNFHAVCTGPHPADLPKLRWLLVAMPSSPHCPPPLCLAAVDAALATVCPTLRLDPCSTPVSGNEEKTSVIHEGRKPPACSSRR